ncbi:hypothetical protein CC86DRAFT_14215 [Ophiobolus disseminans]|uniref:Uncharacterized protein n=1 Tax=Ophiobolus disseminans TaxID=1469910 RepID=A0A6A7AMH0_9PLEO|nr:hypothetical protein CC86DRAFT_14215 [Ophiobolus disseminans]
MKLTLAFLAALAAADAAEARTHRQARREYGYGSPNVGGSYGDVKSSAVKPAETPSPTPAVSSVVEVPYVQSSAPAFVTSLPPNAASSYPPVEATPSPYVTPEVPEGGKSSVVVPAETPYASSAVVVASSAPPAGGDYGAGAPSSTKTPLGAVPSSSAVPSGAYPSGGAGVPSSSLPVEAASSGVYPGSSVVPSGAYPSGGYAAPASSSLPVEAASSGVYPSGGAGYPTGTGVSPASSTPLSDYVTKTIYSTQIYSTGSAVVTKVVPVGTTCIPKGEADKTPSPSAPAKITSKIPVSEVVKTLTETLVYTVGVGSTAHGVTTKVTSTSTSTIYKTIVVTPTAEKSVYPEGGNYPEGPVGTTTVKSTTTSTKYITVKPTPSAGGPGKDNYPVGNAGKSSAIKGEDCAAPVTVTVTQKETVTVTAGVPSKATATPASGEYPSGKPEVPAGGAGKPTPSAKYPINNGTNPYPAGPTGFHTSTKPSYPVGTGVVPKPSETSSLPYFSFVTEVPSPTPAASKTPSVESEVPYVPASSAAPVYTPPAGGEYGAASSSVKPVETPIVSSKVPSNEESYAKPTPSPTPAGSGYGSGYGTY